MSANLGENTENVKNSNELQIYMENHLGNTPINKLNDDCLLEIFQYLPVTERFKLKKGRYCKIHYIIIDFYT